MAQRVWLVTGCSRGFGEQFIKSIIGRGDKAIATARSLESIEKLKDIGAATLELDVSAPFNELQSKTKQAVAFYGRIDVLVNNAGQGVIGALEDLTIDDVLSSMKTNLFGPINLTQAVLPIFREQKSGYLVLISSATTSFSMPFTGSYAASKAAGDAMMRCADAELKSLGINTTIIQPGSFRTDSRNVERAHVASKSQHHQESIDKILATLERTHKTQAGDPEKFANIMIDIVKGEGVAAGRELPQTIPMGPDAFGAVKKRLDAELKTLTEWEDVIKSTDFDGDKGESWFTPSS